MYNLFLFPNRTSNTCKIQSSRLIRFEQDLVFPQVMENGPITKVCQYIHQKFKEYSILSGFAHIAGIV